MTPASWTGPVSNAAVAITFRQHIGANVALRTGTYSKTLTFTLSTTNAVTGPASRPLHAAGSSVASSATRARRSATSSSCSATRISACTVSSVATTWSISSSS